MSSGIHSQFLSKKFKLVFIYFNSIIIINLIVRLSISNSSSQPSNSPSSSPSASSNNSSSGNNTDIDDSSQYEETCGSVCWGGYLAALIILNSLFVLKCKFIKESWAFWIKQSFLALALLLVIIVMNLGSNYSIDIESGCQVYQQQRVCDSRTTLFFNVKYQIGQISLFLLISLIEVLPFQVILLFINQIYFIYIRMEMYKNTFSDSISFFLVYFLSIGTLIMLQKFQTKSHDDNLTVSKISKTPNCNYPRRRNNSSLFQENQQQLVKDPHSNRSCCNYLDHDTGCYHNCKYTDRASSNNQNMTRRDTPNLTTYRLEKGQYGRGEPKLFDSNSNLTKKEIDDNTFYCYNNDLNQPSKTNQNSICSKSNTNNNENYGKHVSQSGINNNINNNINININNNHMNNNNINNIINNHDNNKCKDFILHRDQNPQKSKSILRRRSNSIDRVQEQNQQMLDEKEVFSSNERIYQQSQSRETTAHDQQFSNDLLNQHKTIYQNMCSLNHKRTLNSENGKEETLLPSNFPKQQNNHIHFNIVNHSKNEIQMPPQSNQKQSRSYTNFFKLQNCVNKGGEELQEDDSISVKRKYTQQLERFSDVNVSPFQLNSNHNIISSYYNTINGKESPLSVLQLRPSFFMKRCQSVGNEAGLQQQRQLKNAKMEQVEEQFSRESPLLSDRISNPFTKSMKDSEFSSTNINHKNLSIIYQVFFNFFPEGIIFFDSDMNVVYNNNSCRLLLDCKDNIQLKETIFNLPNLKAEIEQTQQTDYIDSKNKISFESFRYLNPASPKSATDHPNFFNQNNTNITTTNNSTYYNEKMNRSRYSMNIEESPKKNLLKFPSLINQAGYNSPYNNTRGQHFTDNVNSFQMIKMEKITSNQVNLQAEIQKNLVKTQQFIQQNNMETIDSNMILNQTIIINSKSKKNSNMNLMYNTNYTITPNNQALSSNYNNSNNHLYCPPNSNNFQNNSTGSIKQQTPPLQNHTPTALNSTPLINLNTAATNFLQKERNNSFQIGAIANSIYSSSYMPQNTNQYNTSNQGNTPSNNTIPNVNVYTNNNSNNNIVYNNNNNNQLNSPLVQNNNNNTIQNIFNQYPQQASNILGNSNIPNYQTANGNSSIQSNFVNNQNTQQSPPSLNPSYGNTRKISIQCTNPSFGNNAAQNNNNNSNNNNNNNNFINHSYMNFQMSQQYLDKGTPHQQDNLNEYRELEISLFPSVVEGKAMILLMIRDVTHRKYIQHLKMANMHKQQVVSYLSHELRNPLNCIINMLDTVEYDIQALKRVEQDAVNVEEIENNIATALQNSKYILNLSNDYLDMARIKADQFKLNIQPFNLLNLLKDCMKLFTIQAYKVNTKITLKNRWIRNTYFFGTAHQFENTVYSDAERIKQVVINLISNALKFTHNGCIFITAEYINQTQLHVSIKDTGIGIEKSKVKSLFKAFGKIEDEETQNYNQQGVGLGLLISNMLSIQLSKPPNSSQDGGQNNNLNSNSLMNLNLSNNPVGSTQIKQQKGLKVESEKGIGSTFTLTITDHNSQYRQTKMLSKQPIQQITETQESSAILSQSLYENPFAKKSQFDKEPPTKQLTPKLSSVHNPNASILLSNNDNTNNSNGSSPGSHRHKNNTSFNNLNMSKYKKEKSNFIGQSLSQQNIVHPNSSKSFKRLNKLDSPSKEKCKSSTILDCRTTANFKVKSTTSSNNLHSGGSMTMISLTEMSEKVNNLENQFVISRHVGNQLISPFDVIHINNNNLNSNDTSPVRFTFFSKKEKTHSQQHIDNSEDQIANNVKFYPEIKNKFSSGDYSHNALSHQIIQSNQLNTINPVLVIPIQKIIAQLHTPSSPRLMQQNLLQLKRQSKQNSHFSVQQTSTGQEDVLIVDDNIFCCEALKNIIEKRFGLSCMMCYSGIKAVEAVKERFTLSNKKILSNKFDFFYDKVPQLNEKRNKNEVSIELRSPKSKFRHFTYDQNDIEVLSKNGINHQDSNDGEEDSDNIKDDNQKKFFKFIFLDINMPDINGFEALYQIKSFLNQVYTNFSDKCQIVGCSGIDENDIQEQYLSSNTNNNSLSQFDNYLTKPVLKEKLIDFFQQYNISINS